MQIHSSEEEDSFRYQIQQQEGVKDYMNATNLKEDQMEEWDQLLLDSQPQPFQLNDNYDQVQCNQLQERVQDIFDTTFQVLNEQESDYHQIEAFPVIPTQDVTSCQCVKINCKKSYCSCYAKGQLCGVGCSCQNCNNTVIRKQVTFKVNQKGCKCQKNNCLKRYCDCMNKGMECSITCACLNCKNQPKLKESQIKQQSSEDSSDLNSTIIRDVLKIRKKIRKHRHHKKITTNKNKNISF